MPQPQAHRQICIRYPERAVSSELRLPGREWSCERDFSQSFVVSGAQDDVICQSRAKLRSIPKSRYSPHRTAEEFMRREAHLANLVERAEQKLEEAFGLGTTVERELFFSQDESECQPMLYLVAKVRLPSKEARRRMDRLDEDWWFEQLPLTEGKVQIAFEHRARVLSLASLSGRCD